MMNEVDVLKPEVESPVSKGMMTRWRNLNMIVPHPLPLNISNIPIPTTGGKENEEKKRFIDEGGGEVEEVAYTNASA